MQIVYVPDATHVCKREFPALSEHDVDGTILKCSCGRYWKIRVFTGFRAYTQVEHDDYEALKHIYMWEAHNK